MLFRLNSVCAHSRATDGTHTMFNNENRGQVGIGTLIVFIAMVLVAAIAAGVLINTAGLLQSQAESTGQDSTDQVANNLQVVSVTGDANTPADDLADLTLTVALAPGSGAVDLSQVNVTVTGDQSSSSDDTPFSGELTDSGDTEDVDLVAASDLGISEPAEGESLTITLTTADGSQTTKVVDVPDIIEDGASYSL